MGSEDTGSHMDRRGPQGSRYSSSGTLMLCCGGLESIQRFDFAEPCLICGGHDKW